ncbi:hypothetical protein [Actinophytocola sp. NPDC049390]|uniref:hypothetical protein n=1 Tax=Actinophytocola sp. NPDC049390 TaxID=3363894 RepID=UPI0037B6E592
MGLADRLTTPAAAPVHRARVQHPKGFEPGVRYAGGQPVEVTAQLSEIPETETAWREQIQRVTGHALPDDRKVELTQVRYWGDPAKPYVYCRFTISDRGGAGDRLDLEDILTATKAFRQSCPPASNTGRALVVAWADLQVGKVGSRGGTEELVARVIDRLDSLEALAARSGCDSAYLVDVGDCVESFENVPSQAFTNDLSFPEQLRVARRLYTEAALRLARIFPKVTCVGVPSNHGAWRRGKDALGRPGDDFGLEMLTAVADAFALNDSLSHVDFVVPDVWQEVVALDVHGTILAVAHGHQVNRPDQLPLWWAKQVHGGQAAADADILLTGHFHHLRVQPSGRSVHTGRAKWWIQAPTMDNGSDWYRLKAGDDTDPALLTFVVDGNGWSSLELL